MNRSLLPTLVLLVFCAVHGCGRADDEHTATIVIAEGNSLLYKRAGQDQPVIYYGPGDSVLVEWKNDTCYVNAQPHMPHPAAPPKTLTVEHLRSFYGKVPVVIEYVRNHAGDSTEVWNQAYRKWEEQMRQVTHAAFQRYADDLLAGKTPDAAADEVAFVLRLSSLVASASVDKSRSSPNSQQRFVVVYWKGNDYSETLWMGPGGPRDLPRHRPFTLEDFKALVGILRGLEGREPMTVELRGGNMVVATGRDAEKRRGGS